LVIDCTVEGLLHSPDLAVILDSGARVLMISNEHPDVLERLGWDETLPSRVAAHLALLRAAAEMHVVRSTGTDLRVALRGAVTAGSTGLTDGPGSIAHWPGGLVLAFPAAGSVNGTLVLAPGDLNLTFNRFVAEPVRLTIVDDVIVDIEGGGVDSQLFRGYLEAFGDRECFATSHIGWGLNRQARWESVELYDRRETWGTEARAIAGNVLYSCGANEVAGRFTAGHFDLPMRGCTVLLDGVPVVTDGRLIT
jgi:2,5-dihydroxypyridine 5,6-dioxygenase